MTTLIKPIIAYRFWHLNRTPQPSLSGDYFSLYTWPMRTWAKSGCFPIMKLIDTMHNFKNCRCGFHAFKTLKQVMDCIAHSSAFSNLAVGKVWLQGDVIEHEEGYRATLAYPLELYIYERSDTKELRLVAKKYNIPVVEISQV